MNRIPRTPSESPAKQKTHLPDFPGGGFTLSSSWNKLTSRASPRQSKRPYNRDNNNSPDRGSGGTLVTCLHYTVRIVGAQPAEPHKISIQFCMFLARRRIGKLTTGLSGEAQHGSC